ncbi:F234A protein, partial [Cercotrichas coryphoeus]|nr:F234A protein [Cercotrichas coryphoeus]NXC91093.1 F234A protein [Cercotrichas coryphoeus]
NLSLSFLLFFLYFCTENSLYAYSLKDLCSTAVGIEVKLSDFQLDSRWEKHIDHTTHRLELLFGDIHYLTKVPGHLQDDILVVNSEMATLLHTKDLHVAWTLNVSHLLSEPLLGYYKPDDHGIILESEIGPNRKKV